MAPRRERHGSDRSMWHGNTELARPPPRQPGCTWSVMSHDDLEDCSSAPLPVTSDDGGRAGQPPLLAAVPVQSTDPDLVSSSSEPLFAKTSCVATPSLAFGAHASLAVLVVSAIFPLDPERHERSLGGHIGLGLEEVGTARCVEDDEVAVGLAGGVGQRWRSRAAVCLRRHRPGPA